MRVWMVHHAEHAGIWINISKPIAIAMHMQHQQCSISLRFLIHFYCDDDWLPVAFRYFGRKIRALVCLNVMGYVRDTAMFKKRIKYCGNLSNPTYYIMGRAYFTIVLILIKFKLKVAYLLCNWKLRRLERSKLKLRLREKNGE